MQLCICRRVAGTGALSGVRPLPARLQYDAFSIERHLQERGGVLARSSFESDVAGVRFYMSNPGMRVAWQLSSGHFGREFRGLVESIVKDTAVARVPDAYAEWSTLLKSNANIPAA
jgi:hypothetical protein